MKLAFQKQATIEVPDEEKKVFVGGLPHDCKHEDVKVAASKIILHFAVFWTSMFVHLVFFQEHFTRFGGVEKVKLMSDQARIYYILLGYFIYIRIYYILLPMCTTITATISHPTKLLKLVVLVRCLADVFCTIMQICVPLL